MAAFLGCLLLLLEVVHTIRMFLRLRQFPGPPLAAWSKSWILKGIYHKNLHLQLKAACDRYGSVVRIAPNDLVTSDPELLTRISSVRSAYSRSDFYSGTQFDLDLNHVFSERNEERHLDLRRRLGPGYSGKENRFLERSVSERILDLLDLIDREYISSADQLRPLDFAKVAQFFTLDMISDVAFGEPIGFLARNEDINGYCQVAEQALPAFEWAAALPAINRFARLPIINKFVMPNAKDPTGVGMIMGFAKRAVSLRFGPNKVEKSDMLQAFLRHGLSQREAETESALQIMAGSDTTVTALRATVLFIITSPRVHDKVRRELLRLEKVGSMGMDRVVTDNEAKDLPYLLACIRESLRIWPPSFGLMQKVVPKGGDHINGRFVPEGTRVGHCTWGVLRDREVFGPDADAYRPERWLDRSPEDLRNMIRSADLVFGAGRYQCLGKTIAYLELRMCLATIFSLYDISIIDPTAPWKSVAANGMFLQSHMLLRIDKRQDAVDESTYTL
ncbi:pisatin demethylase [Teratosphaeria nubilosa]|uniref:Pisatin demethylase n=1 Tax=Teratosphaeria nubilosa TaxID=161662 RepID=A0A6G1KUR0_9PEZI|nr:pisatin demethylase [Teratosphaeria nubilosa]